MRNLFLALLLANLLVLAWYQWINPPSGPATSVAQQEPRLRLYPANGAPARSAVTPPTGRGAGPVGAVPGACRRVGPFADLAAAQQAAAILARRDVGSRPIAVDSQLWLGRWVQVRGFESVEAAERARSRLVAGGLTDAYLMQDGTGPTISLGVFREDDRARRVAELARQLGFEPVTADRYRPGVEDWLLVTGPAEDLPLEELRLAGGQILRAEPAACDP